MWIRVCSEETAGVKVEPVRAWALVELGDHEAIDVFVRKEDALKALEDPVPMSRSAKGRCSSHRSNSTNRSRQRTSSTVDA